MPGILYPMPCVRIGSYFSKNKSTKKVAFAHQPQRYLKQNLLEFVREHNKKGDASTSPSVTRIGFKPITF